MAEDLGIAAPETKARQKTPEGVPAEEVESIANQDDALPPEPSVPQEPVVKEQTKTPMSSDPKVTVNFTADTFTPPPASPNLPEVAVVPVTSSPPPVQPDPPQEINLEYVNGLVEKMQKALKKLTIYKNFYEGYKNQYESSLKKVEGICEQYMRQLNDQEGIKTFAIPCGVPLKLQKKADKLEFTDYDAALVYVKKNCPEILKTELLISKAKERLKSTGELIPGTEEKKYTELLFSFKIEE